MNFEIPSYLKNSVKVGSAAASAMSIQVISMMWLRTTVNYQYRNGGTMLNAFSTLYKQGGVMRFYRGIGPALLQAPLSRFGDTATNAIVINKLEPYDLPIWIKTLGSSSIASLWRLNLMPLDTLKTIYQVEGKNGTVVLKNKIKEKGLSIFYNGAIATFSASWVGHYPWFATYNTLNIYLPIPKDKDPFYYNLCRNAIIGFSSSVISDTCSNSIRVCKTYKQTYPKEITYPNIIKSIVKKDGIQSLLFRGLKTKILSNGVQGIVFSILWKYFEEQIV